MGKPSIHYEIDPQNRLVVSSKENLRGVPKFRKVLDGEFFIGKDNSLVYHLKKSGGHELPQQVKFSGSWSLDQEDNLVFLLDKWNNQCEGDKLVISCGIVSAEAGELVFSAMSRDSSGKSRIYLLKFSGKWRADARNRLSFDIGREGENIVFSGAWGVDDCNRIIYRYSSKDLKKRRRITQEFSLKGRWDISGRHRVSYALDKKTGSQLDFKASFEKPLANALQYSLGAGLSGRKRVFNIFGSWKISERLGVYFEVAPGKRNGQALLVAGSYKINNGLSLDVSLRNSSGKDLGIEAALSRKFFGSKGEAFLRVLSSKGERGVSAGAGILW